MSETIARDERWIGALEAARLLGVSRATLYAYVSRGHIRSRPRSGRVRQRLYSREDVERVHRRTEERRAPDKATSRALQWGLPVLESSITLVDDGRLYYCGHEVAALASTWTLEDVAALIWTGQLGAVSAPRAVPAVHVPATVRRLPYIARAQSLLAAAAAVDPRAFDLRRTQVTQTGARILHLVTHAAVVAAPIAGLPTAGWTTDVALARAWSVPARGVDVLRAALVLCADHELNVSSFTARCVASAGSHPYAVVSAALGALEGVKHGGATARAEAMLASIRQARAVRAEVESRQRRGEVVEGFGHPLYADGDPRARLLLDLLRERYSRSAEYRAVMAFAEAAADLLGEHPNLDFGLAAVGRMLRLPPGAPLMLFAIGRTVGWIGHAIEQYGIGRLIRPRARYVGPAPVAQGVSSAVQRP